MKIALLLCGQIRTLVDPRVLKAQNRFIKKYDADVFVSTWDDVGISLWDLYKNENIYKDKIVSSEDIKKLENLRSFEINSFQNFIENTENEDIKKRMENYTNALNEGTSTYDTSKFVTSFPQLFTIYRANNMKKDFEKNNHFIYDLVIKGRPDFLFFYEIDKHLDDANNSLSAINTKEDYWPNRVYDIMYFTNSKNMDKLSDAYLNYEKLVKTKFAERIKFKYGNKLANKLEHSQKLAKFINIDKKSKINYFLKGLHGYDCNRIIFESAKNNKINIVDIEYQIGDLVRVEEVEDLDNYILKNINY
tara:strand:- start:13883 stop:14797 length:915 start_codon:yes stop_codon:yes gene_type:complete